MINTRARGLAKLHALVMAVAVSAFFWIYAEIIYRVPYLRLSREVNLLPYFVCALAGVLLADARARRLVIGYRTTDFAEGFRLASRQVAAMSLLTFTMMFVTQDHRISRGFLGSFLVWSWVGLAILNTWVPRRLAQRIFTSEHKLPTLFVGRMAAVSNLTEWIGTREALGLARAGFVSDDRVSTGDELPAPWLGRVSDLRRILSEQRIGQIVLLEFPSSDVETAQIIDLCLEHGIRLLIHADLGHRYTQPLAASFSRVGISSRITCPTFFSSIIRFRLLMGPRNRAASPITVSDMGSSER